MAKKPASAGPIPNSTAAEIEQPSNNSRGDETQNSVDFAHIFKELFIFGAPVNKLKKHQADGASNFPEDLRSEFSWDNNEINISNLSEPAGGESWSGKAWCSAVCREEFDDGSNCSDNHTTNSCRYCGVDPNCGTPLGFATIAITNFKCLALHAIWKGVLPRTTLEKISKRYGTIRTAFGDASPVCGSLKLTEKVKGNATAKYIQAFCSWIG